MRRSARFSATVAATAAFIVVLAPLPSPLRAGGNGTQESPYAVPHTKDRVKIDGILDEPAWNDALALEVNIEVQPGENIPAPVKMTAYLMYDQSNLFVAFTAHDPDPSRILARYCDRDALWDDDWVAIFIDTFNDGRRDYGYIANPFGIQCDIIESEMGGNDAWDAIWDSAGKINSEGYVVEMAIPFNSLSFQRSDGDQVWGLDLVRSYPRSVRHHIGLFPRDRNNNCYMCQAQKISGFANVNPGRNLEITPTLSGVYLQERENGTTGDFRESDKSLDPGLTLRWGFTPNLTFSATGNPDFSQVEADAMQLDINTQFALYYPEKRPFFLEGADFFNTLMDAVHTRSFSDPDWGVKLTGKEGRNAIGVFTAQDNVTNLTFPGSEWSEDTSLEQDFVGTVLRFRRDIKSSSNIGLLVTDREGDDYHNRVVGMDASLNVTKKDEVNVQLLGSSTRYPGDVTTEFGQRAAGFEGGAVEFFYLHDTRSLDWYTICRSFSPDFRADAGFIPRVDYTYTETGAGHTWNNDPDRWWNMLNFGGCAETEHDYSSQRLLYGFSWWFNYRGLKQSMIDLIGFGRVQRYQGQDFYLKGLHYTAGFYPSGDVSIILNGIFREAIDFWNVRDGKRIMFNPVIAYKLGRHLSVDLSHTLELFNVDEGRLYDANISWLKLVYQFNRRTFLRWIGQYRNYRRNAALYVDEVDERTEGFFDQLLFSYKLNPQTVLFLGYSDSFYGDWDTDLVQTDRTFFMKVGYAWAQ